MKKMLITILAVMFVGVVNVNALTKDGLIAKLREEYTVGGEKVTIEESTIVSIEKYLGTVSATEADYQVISDQIDSVKSYFEKNPEEYKNKTNTAKAKITEAFSTIKEQTENRVNVTLEESGISLRDASGEVVGTIESNDVRIQKTNGNYILVAVASVITLAGAAVLTKKIVETRA